MWTFNVQGRIKGRFFGASCMQESLPEFNIEAKRMIIQRISWYFFILHFQSSLGTTA